MTDKPSVAERTEAEISELLNEMLRQWHAHCSGYHIGKGYPTADVVGRNAKSSSVWDGWNGAEDDMARRRIMEAFDAAMWTIPNEPRPYLTALQFQARNLYTGRQVWTSARLPPDQAQRVALLIEARNMLKKALARCGILS